MYRLMLADLRYSVRALLAKPSFALIAVFTLALGIGANAAVYSMFHQLVTRPLAVPDAQKLVNLSAPGPKLGSTSNTGIGPRDAIFSYPMFRDLQAQQQVFTGIAAHRGMAVNLAYEGQTQAGQALLVSPEYFSVLQLQPALGRLIGPQDDQPIGESQVVVLSHRYWMTRLGGANVLNQVIKVNGVGLTIVGVAPPGFSSTTVGSAPQIFVPLSARWLLAPQAPKDYDNRLSYWVYLFARLRPGYTLEQAAAQINQVYGQVINEVEVPLQKGIDEQTLAQFKAKQVQLEPGERGQSSLSASAATPLGLLLGVSGLVLLVACLNTANLLLARGSARAGELAIRASIGASRAQLLRQQLIESLLLAVLGGLASLPVASLCMHALISVMPADASTAINASLDWATMRFAMLVALGTVVIFGLTPALHAANAAPILSLKGAGQQTGGSRFASQFRSALATAQIALSMASLVLAGLFIQSLSNISRADIGMQVNSLATFAVSPQRNGYDVQRSAQLYERIETALAALPGATAVTSSMVPLLTGNNWGTNVSVQGYKSASAQPTSTLYNEVGTGYFQTLDITMLAGRDFSAADSQGRPKVAIVNRRFAQIYGLGEGNAPIGKRMAIGDKTDLDIEIVGVVENSRYDSVKSAAPDQFFLPRRQNDAIGSLNFYVRSALPPEQLLSAITALVARIDPDLPVEDLSTVPQQIRENLVLDHFVSVLSAAFAVLATLLAAGGVYGVLSYTLSQRIREIGLRLALGAAPRRIRFALLGQVARLFAIGGGIGLLLAIALGRSAESMLFELRGHDPSVLFSATVLLASVAFFAAWWPARRAARVDPLVALRWQ